jgi:hypothetical protein
MNLISTFACDVPSKAPSSHQKTSHAKVDIRFIPTASRGWNWFLSLTCQIPECEVAISRCGDKAHGRARDQELGLGQTICQKTSHAKVDIRFIPTASRGWNWFLSLTQPLSLCCVERLKCACQIPECEVAISRCGDKAHGRARDQELGSSHQKTSHAKVDIRFIPTASRGWNWFLSLTQPLSD